MDITESVTQPGRWAWECRRCGEIAPRKYLSRGEAAVHAMAHEKECAPSDASGAMPYLQAEPVSDGCIVRKRP
jgi:hypothetical protein